MSQAKVDKYKEQKKNRDKIMKREKRERIIAEVIVCVVVVALIAWAGYSFYQNHKPTVVNTYSVDSTALRLILMISVPICFPIPLISGIVLAREIYCSSSPSSTM